MSSRFFVETPVDGPQVTLTGSEAQHAARVMRLRPGDPLTLFDGSGREYEACVEAVERGAVRARVLTVRHVDRESPRELTLAIALPKGDRQKWLIEKATELGVRRLIPLHTRRGVAAPTAGALDRLRRAVIEASKQCGRNRLLEIASPQSAAQLLGSPHEPETLRLLADPEGAPFETAVPQHRVIVAVGPEGGFDSEERAAARASGWREVTMGPRIFRVETAALWWAARLC